MHTAYIISNYVQLAGSVAIAISCLLLFSNRQLYIRMLGFYGISCIIFSLAQQASVLFFARAGVNLIGNMSVFSEAFFFSLIFYSATQNLKFKKGIIFSALAYGFFCLVVLLLFEDRLASLIRSTRDFLLIIYSLAYFYYLILKLPEDKLLRLPMFWINSGVIFFFSSTFILSFMIDYIITVLKTDLAGFWTFRNSFRFIFCMMVTYAAWLDMRLILSDRLRVASK